VSKEFATLMPDLGGFEFGGIYWEIEVNDEAMLRKQVLKVETVEVTVDRTNFGCT